MRGSGEAVAVARDVTSSSPSKPASALDMMRYQRPSTDCLPLPNGIGSGSGGGRKPAAAAPTRSSKDDVAPAAATSLEPKPRARAPQPPAPAPAPQTSSAAAVATRSPARDHSHHPADFSDPTSPSSTGGGAGEVLLQWGQNKRSRGRRDASAASAPAGTASPQRRQPSAKIQRRSSAPADKLIPPPSGPPYTRGSNLRVGSSLPPRGAGAGDAHHSRGALPHHRSPEERAVGKSARAEKQRPASDKVQQKAPVVGLTAPDSKQQHQHQSSSSSHPQADQGVPGTSSSKPAGPKLEMPRIYTTLSRKEKEDDFLAMKGTKLPQRPKKRPKNVEKTVNFVCPGMWLTDVTRSRYQVREKKCTKKQKHRGLKGMESMDSDSD